MTDTQELSEGEKFIEEFFIDEQIKYENQKEIKNLKGDNKEFRKADFYLPKFNIYVEFFGQWNVSNEHKERYRDKKRVYERNDIPCVYLYPENLGILKYTFNYRVKRELQKRGMTKELLRFNYYLYNQNNQLTFPVAVGAIGYLLHAFDLLGSYIYLIFLALVGLFALAATYDIIAGLIYYLIVDIRRIKRINKQED
jgi:hypothetical protein